MLEPRLTMRAAAIDFGTVRVGRAIADELNLMAHPRPHLDGRDPGRLVEELRRWAEAESIDTFLVGLPRTLDGREGPMAKRARRFAEILQKRTGRTVELVDERWSTKEAHTLLRAQGLDERRARNRVDSASAAVLLQSWLDARSSGSP